MSTNHLINLLAVGVGDKVLDSVLESQTDATVRLFLHTDVALAVLVYQYAHLQYRITPKLH